MIGLKDAPLTLEEDILKRTNPKTLITSELSQGAKIGLYQLEKNYCIQASVFIYPSTLILTPERILSLTPDFSNVQLREATREFKDLPVEELNRQFLFEIKPLIPFRSPGYIFMRVQILEHSFTYQSLEYLKGTISDIKP